VTNPTKRNPPWTRDEIILALDLYRKVGGVWPSPSDPRVVALSKTLNGLGRSHGHTGATLRNPNGVVMKLMNLRAHDPAYGHHKGLKAGNRLEKEAWQDFAADPDALRAVADAIRSEIDKRSAGIEAETEESDSDYDGVEASEGKLLTALHRRRERSPRLAKRKKEAVLKQAGRLACEACGFDFEAAYGERGRGASLSAIIRSPWPTWNMNARRSWMIWPSYVRIATAWFMPSVRGSR